MNTINRVALVNSGGQPLYQLKEGSRSTAVGGQRRHILAKPAVNNLMGSSDLVLATT
jgi:hypothetical protein